MATLSRVLNGKACRRNSHFVNAVIAVAGENSSFHSLCCYQRAVHEVHVSWWLSAFIETTQKSHLLDSRQKVTSLQAIIRWTQRIRPVALHFYNVELLEINTHEAICLILPSLSVGSFDFEITTVISLFIPVHAWSQRQQAEDSATYLTTAIVIVCYVIVWTKYLFMFISASKISARPMI